MRSYRFFQSGELAIGATVQLDKDVSNHIYRVLRLKVDHEIQVFNGDGHNYQAKIIASGKIVTIEIIDKTIASNESPLQIHLGQAISRGERMDYTLQKSVELGVHMITPLICERVQFRLNENRMQRKIQHWQKIIESACEQTGRCYIPRLNKPVTLEQWLENDDGPGLLFMPEAEAGLMDIEQQTSLRLLVGPEGGLSDDEERLALASRFFKAIKLGPRILRTETAALTAISILQARFGDI